MIVINGLDRLGVHIYITSHGDVLVGCAGDEFTYHQSDAKAFLIEDATKGGAVMIPKREYERLRRR